MESEPAPGPDWEPLLEVVMSGGNVVQRPSLEERRSAHRGEMQRLPESLRALDSHSAYQVHVSSALQEAQRAATEAVRLREGL
jgi:hypothetical protein